MKKAALMEAAKLAAKASRAYAAEAERKGIDTLRQKGMTIVETIDRAQFTAALAAARPEYDKKFGATVIKQIEDAK